MAELQSDTIPRQHFCQRIPRHDATTVSPVLTYAQKNIFQAALKTVPGDFGASLSH
jgi:hypothetical protein